MALAQTNRWMLISKGQGRESERVEADQGIGNGLCSKVESRPSVLIILPKESWLNRKRKGVHCVAWQVQPQQPDHHLHRLRDVRDHLLCKHLCTCVFFNFLRSVIYSLQIESKVFFGETALVLIFDTSRTWISCAWVRIQIIVCPCMRLADHTRFQQNWDKAFYVLIGLSCLPLCVAIQIYLQRWSGTFRLPVWNPQVQTWRLCILSLHCSSPSSRMQRQVCSLLHGPDAFKRVHISHHAVVLAHILQSPWQQPSVWSLTTLDLSSINEHCLFASVCNCTDQLMVTELCCHALYSCLVCCLPVQSKQGCRRRDDLRYSAEAGMTADERGSAAGNSVWGWQSCAGVASGKRTLTCSAKPAPKQMLHICYVPAELERMVWLQSRQPLATGRKRFTSQGNKWKWLLAQEGATELSPLGPCGFALGAAFGEVERI